MADGRQPTAAEAVIGELWMDLVSLGALWDTGTLAGHIAHGIRRLLTGWLLGTGLSRSLLTMRWMENTPDDRVQQQSACLRPNGCMPSACPSAIMSSHTAPGTADSKAHIHLALVTDGSRTPTALHRTHHFQ